MLDEKVVSPDEYILVRGMPQPKIYLIEMSRQFDGAGLVTDPRELAILDQHLAKFRVQAQISGKSLNPKGNRFQDNANKTWYYFCDYQVPTGIYLPGLPILSTRNISSPIWFKKGMLL